MNLPKSCSRNFKKFFEWSQKFLKKHDKKTTLVNAKSVKIDGERCGGWCDDEEMAIAIKNPLFERIYVHEFSHMQQNINGSPYWKDTSLFWKHLGKINSWDSALDIIALERDCEKRAMRHSEKWNLFDNIKYAKMANVYLHYYQYVFLKRKWGNSVTIYHPKLIKAMPETLKPTSSFKKIDMALMLLFEECLSKKKK